MDCGYKAVCPFFRRKAPIHDAMYAQNVKKYCDGEQPQCAVFQVIQKTSFLDVPTDLYPNQTFRLKTILR
jgi:hypothetical protein